MNINLRLPKFVVTAAFLVISLSTQAQNTPSYKEMVVENPNAEKDIKLVSDYTNAVISGDHEKARSLASPTYMAHGPAATDSANIDQTLKNWAEGNKINLNRKSRFVSQTFRVVSGPLKGDWVSQWGDYTFTSAVTGKTITFPFNYTAKVANGKVLGDRIYFDNLSILQQLGYKITPPETVKK